MKNVLLPVIAVCVIMACSNGSENSEGKLQGLRKFYYSGGELYLEINYKDSLPHGTFKQYFKSGKLFEQSEYVNGALHGPSKKFHDNGQLSSEITYDMGRIHGFYKKFRKDGKPAFEVPYYYDKPCVGLKEYYTSGNLVTNYPTIVIRPRKDLSGNGQYVLEISLSDKSKSVEFFRGELTDNRYIGKDAEKINTQDGVGKIYYALPRGATLKENINIIAKAKTDLRNFYITQTTHTLTVRNR